LAKTSKRIVNEGEKGQHEEDSKDGEEGQGFARSEKASRAAQVNLSARLNKDGLAHGSKAGVSEVWRLIKIARPEAKYLGGIPICALLVRMEGC
jgi:putative ABC transport system ATP-binding protein